jgi:APA family basic amino acid/polyamine antiporter
MAATSRIGETAALNLFGPTGAKLISAAVLVSIFGCLSATILYSSRLYGPMAEDGLFFRSMAAIHPTRLTPTRSLWSQSSWAVLLVLTGTYERLYVYVTFAVVLFQVAVGASVFVLRRTQRDRPRPYRVPGYPVIPALFVLASAGLAVNTVIAKPRDALLGLAIIALGVPAFLHWRRSSRAPR